MYQTQPLSKYQALDTDPKAIKKIYFTINLDRAGNAMFSICKELKEIILDFSQGIISVL